MTIILRLKFTGMNEMEKVMKWTETHIKCRINENEELLVNNKNRIAKLEYLCSS